MSNKNNPERANAELDALLSKGVQADKRATRPAIPVAPLPLPQSPQASPPNYAVPTSNPTLERLTVRFTQDEARLLEKARGAARAMGYKISDTAVFRLALNTLNTDRMTAQAIEAVLAADSRRRSQRAG